MVRCIVVVFIALLAGSATVVPASAGRLRAKRSGFVSSPQGCAKLANKGTYFTVQVAVGTPVEGSLAQTFDLVADTGSDNIIVESCECQKKGTCDRGDKCFVGTEHSSTFHLAHGKAGVRSVSLAFGSGTIDAAVATDVVNIGGISATAEQSLFLMYDHRLNFQGPFEGILGLGIPKNGSISRVGGSNRQNSRASGIVKRIIEEILGGRKRQVTNPFAVGTSTQELAHFSEEATWKPKSMLELAGITRFSMCFTERTDGVLRLGTPALKAPLSSVGVMHWGLDFRGIRIGDSTKPILCSTDEMPATQDTPCGIIPDSGTTNILGPQEDVNDLLDAICDGWARCRSNFTALVKAGEAAAQASADVYGFDPFGFTNITSKKRDVLNLLLADCDSWISDGDGLRELPSLHFGVASVANERNQSIELTGWSYVVEYSFNQTERSELQKVAQQKLPKRMCKHSFGPMEYRTKSNGPVWILGTPLFYTYRVDYESGTSPPSMSFTKLSDEPCGACENNAVLMSEAHHTQNSLQSSPRRIWGQARSPAIDVSQPL
eukprot:TRINITY_DN174_c0_g1_i3.p1 TRINITY_DN174_c0_g1~~TRINITY_DN174_c0_g1_i3.p1  ORF type:complete len:548 (-),score=76.45 TRINITY_DN174_c0_g1_i3:112-1755(-)